METMRRPPLPKTTSVKGSHPNTENPQRLPKLKLNKNKFPQSFFGKPPHINSTRKISQRIPMIDKNHTQKKQTSKRYEDQYKLLPQAEVTCFFKMAEIITSQTTLPDSPTKFHPFSNQLVSIPSDAMTQSIEKAVSMQIISEEKLKQDQWFSCTFAKKQDISHQITPAKQKKIVPASDQVWTQKKKQKSRRNLKKAEAKIQSLTSMTRRKNENKENLTPNKKMSRMEKRKDQEFFLPPIQ